MTQNNVEIIHNDATGDAVALHITGENFAGGKIKETINFHDATIGELVDGTTTLVYPNVAGTFTFTLNTHENDGDTAGKVAYDALAALLTHTKHAHGDPAPVVADPLVERIKLLEAQLLKPAKVYDIAHLSMFYNDAGEIVGHEWQLSMRGANDTLTARNAHFIDIENQAGDAPPQLVIRYYDNKRRIVDEARATISTNDFAGWRFVLNGKRLPVIFSGSEAYTQLLLAENPPSEP